ncbi:MAG: hypothetical protein JWR19_1356 [Pedosphaera sp.]|nr:hypothetical protein [Pedosphaera sp.]
MSRNAQLKARTPRLVIYGAGLVLALLLPRSTVAQTPLFTPTPDKRAPTARVVVVEDPGATEELLAVPDRIQAMVARAMTNLTGKALVADAWRSLVSTQDVVGIKIFSEPGPNSGTRPVVVAAVVQDLLAAGVPPNHIIVWDRRNIDLRMAGFCDMEQRYGIRVMGSSDAGYDEKTFYETALLGNPIWTDLEFGRKGPGIGRKSYVSKLVVKEMTKIINITPLMHHNLVGVSGNLYGLAMGSVDNTTRFQTDADTMGRSIPEIYALPILGDRVVLNIVDALICQYEGQDRGLLHYSSVLNELRFSRDPVALDVLSIQEIDRQRQLAGILNVKTNLDLYPNASLLEIGVSNPKHIQIDKLTVKPPL